MFRNIINCILFFISIIFYTVIFLLCLEIYLRYTIVNPYIFYDKIYFIPEKIEQYYKSIFLEKYDKKYFRHIENYDSFLGWDYHIPTGRMRVNKNQDSQTIKIIAIGNSFTYGVQVDSSDCYPECLERIFQKKIRKPVHVINMGVAGYGIDQSVLKYLKYGHQYNPKLVILGIYTRDYIRAAVSFYSYSKPLFKRKENLNNILITNTPIVQPDKMYDIIKYEQKNISYALIFIKSKFLYILYNIINPSDPNNFYEKTDIINEYILSTINKKLLEIDADLLIIQIPDGKYFLDKQTLKDGFNEKFSIHYRNTYSKIGLQYIDLLEELPKRFTLQEIFYDFYFRNPDNTMGHLTPKGNFELAKIIFEKIETLKLVKENREN